MWKAVTNARPIWDTYYILKNDYQNLIKSKLFANIEDFYAIIYYI